MAQLLVVKTAELASYEAIKWRLVTCDEVDQGGELRGEALKIIGDRTLLLAEGGTIAPPPPYKVVRNSHKGRQSDVEFALVVTQTNQWGENTYYRGRKPRKNRKTSSGSSDDDDDDDDDNEGGVTALIETGVTAMINGVSSMMGSEESKSDSGAICVGEEKDADDGAVASVGDAGGVTSSHSYHHTFSFGDSTSGHTEVATSGYTEVASSSHTEVASSSHTEVASSSRTEVTTSSYSENTTSSYSGNTTSSYSGGYSSYSGGGGGGDYSGGGGSGGGGGGDYGGGDD